MPYRRGDLTLVDDEVRFGYVAAHGYACVRVDLRGSGDSEGILDDEYSPQEQADLVEVIAWIAEQPWCTGAVGMTGISWSGFNSLEVAAHRPPALKAIITVCSSDDRYDNDVHYIGGAVLAFYMAVWGHVMLAFNARPPDPDVVGEQWRAIWLDRLERNRLMTETWLAHQTRDHYWAQGSVIEDYAAIRCPVLAVGGWSDAYTDTLLRLGAGLSSPVRVIVGPWGHTWPERGAPGPAIGFLQECVSWWDRWLKDIPNGADEEPLLRYYRQEYATPRADLDERPGRWLAAASIPTVEHGAHGLDLGNRTIGAGPSGDILSIRTAQSLGALAGSWLPYGNPTDLPPDQSPEDAGSLVFDSAPFTADLDVLGQPVLEVVVSSDRPQANLVVRLCEIAPDGSSALLTRGVLNLTHRGGHKQPEPLEPGCTYRVRVPLKAIGVRIAAGHRLRVAVSTTYWPWVWPSPEEATVSLHLGAGSRLLLPTPPDGVPFTPFAPPVTAAPPEVESLRERRPRLGEIAHDPVTGEHVYALRRDLNGIQRFPSGLVYDDTEDGRFTITDGDPLSARVELHRVTSISRGGWRTTVETESEMWSTAADFHLRSRQVAHEGDHVVFEREITATLPRRLT
jgi:putative CocE/NonD family hydrolase